MGHLSQCPKNILFQVSQWKGPVSGHWDKCPIRKKAKKKLGKIPNSKIVTLWHDYFMPSVTLEGSGDKSENYWKKYFWDTGTSVPFEKIDKKKLGKIPNSKILTLWHDYFMPGVTMEGSGVTPDNNLKNDFLGHCDQCPNRKINKKKYWGNHYLLEIF